MELSENDYQIATEELGRCKSLLPKAKSSLHKVQLEIKIGQLKDRIKQAHKARYARTNGS